MPSASDIFHELQVANGHLIDIANKVDGVKASTDAVRASVDQVANILSSGLGQLITLTAYTTQALYQNDLQNGTIICILEKIAKNTCDLVNQSYLQTARQTHIEESTARLAALYALTNARDALILEHERELRREIEKCCPPAPPAPPCVDKPCPAPKPIDPPPPVIVIE